ncbi:hypothetical protein RHDE110596_18745 [Prescottella defluvii]|nr:hypothetical protein [Prescottella defluvii]
MDTASLTSLLGGLLGNLDLGSLTSLLGNVDLGSLTSLLAS